MRAAPLLSLLIPATLGGGLGLLLVSCHKDPPPQAKAAAAATRRLKLEAYDAPIPKAPLPAEKLETIAPHPQAAAVPAPVQAPPQRQLARSEQQAAPRPPRQPPPRYYPPAYAYADPGYGRFVESRQAGAPSPNDPRYDAPPEPAGFRIDIRMCRRAARQGDPLAETAECQGILQAAQAQAEACARAYEIGDDRVVLSAACRQAAAAR